MMRRQMTTAQSLSPRSKRKEMPTGALCRFLHGTLVGFFFCLIPHEPQTAPRHAPKCSCGLCGFLCYVVNGLQNHTPNPYKIAFSSFTIRVRISCSSVLQSKSRRWISESAVEAECVRLSTRRSSADMPRGWRYQPVLPDWDG